MSVLCAHPLFVLSRDPRSQIGTCMCIYPHAALTRVLPRSRGWRLVDRKFTLFTAISGTCGRLDLGLSTRLNRRHRQAPPLRKLSLLNLAPLLLQTTHCNTLLRTHPKTLLCCGMRLATTGPLERNVVSSDIVILLHPRIDSEMSTPSSARAIVKIDGRGLVLPTAHMKTLILMCHCHANNELSTNGTQTNSTSLFNSYTHEVNYPTPA